MRVAVIGANGQVGTDVVAAARFGGLDAIPLMHADCEVTDRASLDRALRCLQAGDVVVNTAAYHRSEECERHPEVALSVNALGAHHAAAATDARGAAIVYFSTDYVFDGAKRAPYVESDCPSPVNVYAASKAAGETLTRLANPRAYVIRISSVFGTAGSSGKGANFVDRMVAKAQAGETVRVVNDVVMTPTSASDAARLLIALLAKNAAFGTYHLANSGQCSWWEFTKEIFSLCGFLAQPQAVSSKEFSAAAPRPAYSVLASEKLPTLGLHPRPWQDALAEYLELKGHRKKAVS